MVFGVLFGDGHQGPEAGQGPVKTGPGDQVGPSGQLGQLHGAVGGVENDRDLLTVLLSGDADQGQIIPGVLPEEPSPL